MFFWGMTNTYVDTDTGNVFARPALAVVGGVVALAGAASSYLIAVRLKRGNEVVRGRKLARAGFLIPIIFAAILILGALTQGM